MDYSIKIDEFEGPLDLLLHLIKQENIDIKDISINKITDQYLEYINKMEELNINIASSYLVMAAELMEIKSSSLLPNRKKEELNDDYEEDPKERLINKLIEYQKYKDITSIFKDLEEKRKDIFVKTPENISNYTLDVSSNKDNLSVDELLKAFKNFLDRKEIERPLNTKITNKEYSVKKRKIDIRNKLMKEKKIVFTSLFEEYNKSYIVVTFLSILEMTKEEEINIKQDNNFSDIYVELRNK